MVGDIIGKSDKKKTPTATHVVEYKQKETGLRGLAGKEDQTLTADLWSHRVVDFVGCCVDASEFLFSVGFLTAFTPSQPDINLFWRGGCYLQLWYQN